MNSSTNHNGIRLFRQDSGIPGHISAAVQYTFHRHI